MIKRFFPDRVTRDRLLAGPLGSHIESFAAILASRGYTRTTAREKLRALGHFNRWLHQYRLSVAELDESVIEKFCLYRRRLGRVDCAAVPTLKSLLAYLRERGQAPVPEPITDDSLRHRLESNYAQYLVQERGLASATLSNYLPVAQDLLRERFGRGELALGELGARDIHRFVVRQSRRVSRRRAQLIVTALRSFLRYLHQRGHISADLAATVPTVANWRLAQLPKALPTQQVEQLLASCDRRSPVGRRDYAILLLLARLGLRAGEVVAMTLDDIDWEGAVVNVRGKGPRHDPLPLPQDVGEALVDYLRHARPGCDTRRIFIRGRAPRCGFASSCAIEDVVERAFARAGLEPAFKGAHVLRHSLATRLLQHGASLAEIGDLLRHRRPETTQIYAKVDLKALRALAQPWPGGVR